MRLFVRLILAAAVIGAGIAFVFVGCGEDKRVVSSNGGDGGEDTIPAVWKLEIGHDTGVVLGHYHDIDVTLTACSTAIGGFDLLIGYEAGALMFAEATLGQYFLDCGWEYFTYRFFYDDTCNGQCPYGLIRLIGMAETNNGAVHPDVPCLADAAGQILATMTFFVSADHLLQCTKHPIRFYWSDCGDNTIANFTLDSLGINRRIYDVDSARIEDYMAGFPGCAGAPDDSCLYADKIVPFRGIDFVDGGIDLLCADSLIARGDLNMNGIPNEIADAVLYTDYFIQGISVFEPHVHASTVASDVNGDGQTLTPADLEYLIRIIQGNALPFPPQLPDTSAFVVYYDGHVYLISPVDVGAVLLKFDLKGIAGAPTLTVPDMSMKDSVDNDELRVLIYDIGGGYIPAGTAEILTVPATAALISADAAGYEGNAIQVTVYIPPMTIGESGFFLDRDIK